MAWLEAAIYRCSAKQSFQNFKKIFRKIIWRSTWFYRVTTGSQKLYKEQKNEQFITALIFSQFIKALDLNFFPTHISKYQASKTLLKALELIKCSIIKQM